MAPGCGGVSAVAKATGLSRNAVHKGMRKLESNVTLPSHRQRRFGAGRKPLEDHQPELIDAIDALVEPTERGDPQSPLRRCRLAPAVAFLHMQGRQRGITNLLCQVIPP